MLSLEIAFADFFLGIFADRIFACASTVCSVVF
jgi:hypothetical protein